MGTSMKKLELYVKKRVLSPDVSMGRERFVRQNHKKELSIGARVYDCLPD